LSKLHSYALGRKADVDSTYDCTALYWLYCHLFCDYGWLLREYVSVISRVRCQNGEASCWWSGELGIEAPITRIVFFFAAKCKCICRNYIIKISLLHKCVSCVYMQDVFPDNSFDYFNFDLHFVHSTYINIDCSCVFTTKYYDVGELRIDPIITKDKLFRCNGLAQTRG
jgi:hypothetical protein